MVACILLLASYLHSYILHTTYYILYLGINRSTRIHAGETICPGYASSTCSTEYTLYSSLHLHQERKEIRLNLFIIYNPYYIRTSRSKRTNLFGLLALALVGVLGLLVSLACCTGQGKEYSRTYVAVVGLADTEGAVLLAVTVEGDLSWLVSVWSRRRGWRRMEMEDGHTDLPPPAAMAIEAKRTEARMDSFIVIDWLCFLFFGIERLRVVDGRGKWTRAMGVFISRDAYYSELFYYYSVSSIRFYSESPEIHRQFDDAFVWLCWDRSIA